MKPKKDTDIILSDATLDDIKTLANHHRRMFKEIWESKGDVLSEGELDALEKGYTEKLEEQFVDNTCKSWVVKDGNKIVASGAITICSFVPTPLDLSHKLAFFHSLYTEPESRNRNCANIILKKAVHYCKVNGMKRVLLGASDAGRPIYQKVGFKPASDLMRLFIEDE